MVKYKNNNPPPTWAHNRTQCGRTITTTYSKSKGMRNRYYVCINRQKNGKQVCDCLILPAEAVE